MASNPCRPLSSNLSAINTFMTAPYCGERPLFAPGQSILKSYDLATRHEASARTMSISAALSHLRLRLPSDRRPWLETERRRRPPYLYSLIFPALLSLESHRQN